MNVGEEMSVATDSELRRYAQGYRSGSRDMHRKDINILTSYFVKTEGVELEAALERASSILNVEDW